jgi:hypothetical protein
MRHAIHAGYRAVVSEDRHHVIAFSPASLAHSRSLDRRYSGSGCPHVSQVGNDGKGLSSQERECLTPEVLKDTFGGKHDAQSSPAALFSERQRRRVHAGIRHRARNV